MYTLNLGRTVSKDLYVIFTSGSSAGTVKCEIIPIAAVPMETVTTFPFVSFLML